MTDSVSADPQARRDRLVDVQELAGYLGVPVTTLYQWRYRSEGPPGFRVGRHVRYRWRDVEDWIAEQLRSQIDHQRIDGNRRPSKK